MLLEENTFIFLSFFVKIWQIIFQPAPVQPAPVHSKGEARHPDCSLKHLIAGDNDDDDDDHDHSKTMMDNCVIYAICTVVSHGTQTCTKRKKII